MITVLGFSLSVDECIAVPELVPGSHYRGRLVARQAAGKSVNVARTLGRLGVECRLAAFVGAGEESYFRESLRALPVQCDLIPVAEITRRATTVVLESSGEEVHITYLSFAVPADALAELSEYVAKRLAPGDILAVSGSAAPGMSPEAVGSMLAEAKGRGAAIYVDTSGEALAAAARTAPDGVRVNRSELAEWHAIRYPDAAVPDVDEQVAELLSRGVGSALISAGAEGALLATPGSTLRARCAVTGPVHTVGAGDAQFAGWLAAVDRGETDAREALRYAVAVAAARLRHVLPGEVEPADVEALAGQVELAG